MYQLGVLVAAGGGMLCILAQGEMCYPVKEEVVEPEKAVCADVWGRAIYPDSKLYLLSGAQCGGDGQGLLLVFAPRDMVLFCAVVLLELYLHVVFNPGCKPVTCAAGER